MEPLPPQDIASECSKYSEKMNIIVAGGSNFIKKIKVAPTTTTKEIYNLLVPSFPNRTIALALPGWFGLQKDRTGNFINLTEGMQNTDEANKSFLYTLTEVYGVIMKDNEFLVVMDNIPVHNGH